MNDPCWLLISCIPQAIWCISAKLFKVSNELILAKFVDFYFKVKLIDFLVHFISFPICTVFKFSLIPLKSSCQYHSKMSVVNIANNFPTGKCHGHLSSSSYLPSQQYLAFLIILPLWNTFFTWCSRTHILLVFPCHTPSHSPLLLPPPLLDLLILQAPMSQSLNLFYFVRTDTSWWPLQSHGFRFYLCIDDPKFIAVIWTKMLISGLLNSITFPESLLAFLNGNSNLLC